MRSKIIVLCGFTVLLGRLALGAPALTPTVPPAHPDVGMAMAYIERLGDSGCAWDRVQQRLPVFQFQINSLAFLAPKEDIARVGAIIKARKMEVAVDAGLFDWESDPAALEQPTPKEISDRVRQTLDDQVGEATAATEMRKIRSLTEAGLTPDIIIMDGPIRRLLSPGEDVGQPAPPGLGSLDRAVGEVLDFMRAWRERYPKIRFVAIVNFPNWAWKDQPAYRPDRRGWGDYAPALHALARGAREAGLPLAAIRVDTPLEYMTGDMALPTGAWDPHSVDWIARLRDLEQTVRAEGLQFEMIINSDTGGMTSAREFYRQTLRHLALCRQSGLTPDFYLVHSWFPYPQQAGPEDEPYTMTNLVKAVMEDLAGAPGTALARELSKPLPPQADPSLDLKEPAAAGANTCPDGLGLGEWSCWLAGGDPRPITLGPGRAEFKPMVWNDLTGDDRGFTAASGQDYPSIRAGRLARVQLVPHVGADPVLRWTALKAGRIHLDGGWWLAQRGGKMDLAIFVDGQPLFQREGYTDPSAPGLAFAYDLEVKPGTRIEWWADAAGDPAYDTMLLRLVLTPRP